MATFRILQLLNTFWGNVLEKPKQFSGPGSKMDSLSKRKGVAKEKTKQKKN